MVHMAPMCRECWGESSRPYSAAPAPFMPSSTLILSQNHSSRAPALPVRTRLRNEGDWSPRRARSKRSCRKAGMAEPHKSVFRRAPPGTFIEPASGGPSTTGCQSHKAGSSPACVQRRGACCPRICLIEAEMSSQGPSGWLHVDSLIVGVSRCGGAKAFRHGCTARRCKFARHKVFDFQQTDGNVFGHSRPGFVPWRCRPSPSKIHLLGLVSPEWEAPLLHEGNEPQARNEKMSLARSSGMLVTWISSQADLRSAPWSASWRTPLLLCTMFFSSTSFRRSPPIAACAQCKSHQLEVPPAPGR